MGSFQKSKKLTVKQVRKKLFRALELTLVLLALILPLFLLSSQVEKVSMSLETTSTCNLQAWLQGIIGCIEHF